MWNDQEKFEPIERYLSGEMPEPERTAFETAVQADPALAEMLALHRSLRNSLGNRRRRQLLDALSAVVEPETRRRLAAIPRIRLAAAAAVLLLLAAGGAWLYLRQRPQLPGAIVEQPARALPPAPDSTRTIPLQSPESGPASPGPLASADPQAFRPNPALDPLANTLVRGGQMEVSIRRPKSDAVLPFRKGKIQFSLEGQISDSTALTLRICNNREADFIAGKALYRSDLPVRDHAFNCTLSLKMAPGRYYAVLSIPGDDEPLAVLRFFAGSRK